MFRNMNQRPSPPRCPQTTPPGASRRTESEPIGAPIKTSGTPTLNRTLLWLIAGASGMLALLSLLSAAGHDQLWFLLMARRWLDGATLDGPVIFDSNPPLIVWLSAVPVKLASALPLPFADPATAWAKLLVLALFAAVARLCWTFLRQLLPDAGRTDRLALTFAFLVLAGVVPARDFGQRDHLTGILCLPYILAAALSASPRARTSRARVARGLAALLAAVGICLKPHQLLLILAVELACLLLWLRADRRLPRRPSGTTRVPLARPEPWIIAAAGAVFLASIRRFAPAYLSLALPLLHETYWAIGHLSPLELLSQSLQLHLLAICAIALFVWQKPARSASPRAGNATGKSSSPDAPGRRAILLLLAAGCGATLAFYLQDTGWYYQQLPAITLFAAALALTLLPSLTTLRSIPRHLPAAAAALSLLAVLLTAFGLRDDIRVPGAFAFASPDPALFAGLPPGAPVAILTTSVEDTMMPVARFHLQWAQRTNNLWLFPAVLRLEDPSAARPRAARSITPAQVAALDTLEHRWMVEDLTRWQPQLVLIKRCQDPHVLCQALEDRHDDLLAWFARDPRFRELWRSYRPLRRAGDYDAWILCDDQTLRDDQPSPKP